jgi:hypothetical protein
MRIGNTPLYPNPPQSAGPRADGDFMKNIAQGPGECETCKNRKYQDGSNDPSVSFQAPARINPSQAGAVVASHEREHVAHEQAKAAEEGRKVISQTVSLKTGICPECKRVYVSGGVTRTLTTGDGGPEARGSVDLLA